jgi:hypothetical protein
MKQSPAMMSQKNAAVTSTTTTILKPISSSLPLSPPSSQELPDDNNAAAALSVNNTDYPSPPLEIDFKEKTVQQTLSSKYARTDSGIELGVLSPPPQSNELLACSAGVKRQFDYEHGLDMSIITTNKRQCQ